MSRFFTTAACVLTLLAPAAFAQSSMQHDMGNAMKHDSMSKPADNMAPAALDVGMSHNSMSHNNMSHDSMAPAATGHASGMAQ